MTDVRYDQATRVYPGTNVPAVDRLDLQIEAGEFMVLVGPSGCGKTTALRMLELAPDGVEVVEEVGADAYLFCASEIAGETMRLVARTETRRAPCRGERVALQPRPGEAHLFNPESGELLLVR